MNRRAFVTGATLGAAALGGLAAPAWAGKQRLQDWAGGSAFDAWVGERMQQANIPGLSLAIVDRGELVRVAAFGWANIAQRRAMRTDTLLNIASVTKVITATAVMQLWERKKLQLDDDINRHLPFPVRNPAHPTVPITVRQLLTHTASIADGAAYEASYACGDPQTPLGTWLRSYFSAPSAAGPTDNFHKSAPGELHGYSNVGYGLLGYLVEVISGTPYEQYCAKNIFSPLGMSNSRYSLAGSKPDQHATPYTYVADGDLAKVQLRDPSWSPPAATEGGMSVPHCLYSFATTPDGLARSSADEMARLLLAFIHRGELSGQQILRSDSVTRMLTDERVTQGPQRPGADVTLQGLAWHAWPAKYGSEMVWGHTGSDPGIKTLLAFRPSDRRGVVVLGHARGGPDAATAIATAVFSRR